MLSEHHTLRVLEQKSPSKTWEPRDCLELLDFHVSYLEGLNNNLAMTDWLERDRKAQRLPFVFERFHLTHVYHFDKLAWSDVATIDQRLGKLNSKLCILTIEPADMKTRIVDDYNKSGWQDYLKTLGDSEDEIIEHFVRKQDEILSLCEKTTLDYQIFNTSSMNTEQITEAVIDFYSLY